jgi:hypothetical protein
MAKLNVPFFVKNTINITVLFNAYPFSSEAFYKCVIGRHEAISVVLRQLVRSSLAPFTAGANSSWTFQ